MAALALNRNLYELIPPDATDCSLQAQVWSSLSRLNNGELHELQQWLEKRQGGGPPARFFAMLGVRLAGKSTIGRLLAKKLETDFLELDRNIEAAAGMPVGTSSPCTAKRTTGGWNVKNLKRSLLLPRVACWSPADLS